MKSQGIFDRETQQKEPVKSHIFSLRSNKLTSKNKFNVEIDLSCSTEASNSSFDEEQFSPIRWNRPIFNRDGGVFTPAFVLPDDKPQAGHKFGWTQSKLCTNQKQLDEGECIIIAKPTSTYCSVCKVHFTDYLNHTKREEHRKNIKKDNKKLKMEELFSYFESYGKSKKVKASSQDISSFETKKKKVRILDDPTTFNPVPMSKVIESTTNQSSMHRSSIQLKPSTFLQY